MSLFRKKERPYYGYQLLEERNELTGQKRWRVWRRGGYYLPAFIKDFDNYDEAFACYADKVGWRTEGIRRAEDDR